MYVKVVEIGKNNSYFQDWHQCNGWAIDPSGALDLLSVGDEVIASYGPRSWLRVEKVLEDGEEWGKFMTVPVSGDAEAEEVAQAIVEPFGI